MIRILFVLFGTLAPLIAVPLSNNQNEVKNPLDNVLIGYDKRVRPYFGSGRPVTVGVSAYVLSISSISEVDMVNWSFFIAVKCVIKKRKSTKGNGFVICIIKSNKIKVQMVAKYIFLFFITRLDLVSSRDSREPKNLYFSSWINGAKGKCSGNSTKEMVW